MSPEQARGLPVDKRTDIWAFGCVLYEMLTGRVAFAGDTVSDSIAKILEREPDWSALPAATPASIRRLLLRCLAKDPKKRLRDIGDVQDRDRRDRRGAAGRDRHGGAARSSDEPRRQWLPWVALAAVAAAVGAWAAHDQPTTDENPLAERDVLAASRIGQGTEEQAEISPDGRFVAFLADRDGQFDVWLSQLGTGEFRQPHARPPPDDDARESPAKPRILGRRVGHLVQSSRAIPDEKRSLMPLTGGVARPFLGAGQSTPSWSPDDDRLVRLSPPIGDPLFLADRTGANPDDRACPGQRKPQGGRLRAAVDWLRGRSVTGESGETNRSFSRKACTHTIRSGHQTANGFTSCTGRTRSARWTCGA